MPELFEPERDSNPDLCDGSALSVELLIAILLIAQLVEHCSSISMVRVRVPFKPEFFRPYFCYVLLKWQSISATIINIKIASTRSSNEFSLIRSQTDVANLK